MRREFYTIAGIGGDGAWAPADPSVPVPSAMGPRSDRGPLAGWPLPAKLLAVAWLPTGQYKLQSGDTLAGLARTYLGEFSRWREIWSVQPASFKTLPRRVDEAKRKGQTSADVIFAGEILEMPAEAIAEAREQGLLARHDVVSFKEPTASAAPSSPFKFAAAMATIGLLGFGLSENWHGKLSR